MWVGKRAEGMGVVSPLGCERTASNVHLPPIGRESNSNTFLSFRCRSRPLRRECVRCCVVDLRFSLDLCRHSMDACAA